MKLLHTNHTKQPIMKNTPHTYFLIDPDAKTVTEVIVNTEEDNIDQECKQIRNHLECDLFVGMDVRIADKNFRILYRYDCLDPPFECPAIFFREHAKFDNIEFMGPPPIIPSRALLHDLDGDNMKPANTTKEDILNSVNFRQFYCS
jgi:hypothetical protein